MTITRTLAGIGVACAVALTACAAPGGDSATPTTESGSASADPAQQGDDADELEAAWLDGGRMIGIVTIGSSTCVPGAGEVSADGQTIDVELTDLSADAACTTDLVPRATLVAVPDGVDPAQDVAIHVAGAGIEGDVELEGVDGPDPNAASDYLPSAGWAGDDQLVILTWGSSSCAPVVETVAMSGPAEVTVTFATPPDDQPCTADMAPRGTVVVVDELDDDVEAFVVLTGAEFENVRVPIAGS